jgi:ectoine hydroxylase-related dioxygenase (phytanoyl-CoA dioxygenase family)
MARIQLTDEQLKAYHEDGFVVLEDVFDPDTMAELDSVLTAYFEKHERELREQGDSGISRAGEIAFTHDIAEKDDQVRAFVTRQEFVDIATQLLGPDVDLYWNQTVYKQPEGEKEFPWHQDDGYTPVTPSPYLTLWLAINDATTENGCISVLPKSHQNGLVEHQQTPIGLSCYSSEAPDQGIQVPVRSGSMAAFQSLTMHKSGPNRSKGIRKAYVIQYSHHPLKFAVSGEVITGKIPVARDGASPS